MIGGGEMLVAAGGGYVQPLVNYLESKQLHRADLRRLRYNIVLLQDARLGRTSATVARRATRRWGRREQCERRERWGRRGGTATTVLSVPQSSITEGHSYFVIETVTEPTSGTFTLCGIRAQWPGGRGRPPGTSATRCSRSEIPSPRAGTSTNGEIKTPTWHLTLTSLRSSRRAPICPPDCRRRARPGPEKQE